MRIAHRMIQVFVVHICIKDTFDGGGMQSLPESFGDLICSVTTTAFVLKDVVIKMNLLL